MLGSNFIYSWKDKYNIFVTYKRSQNSYSKLSELPSENCFFNIDPFRDDKLKNIIIKCKPDFVVNCIGITKTLINKNLLPEYEYINSILPHDLNKICSNTSSKLILLSSDCVFSGKDGNYNEKSIPDANDNYGKTKIKGEVIDCRNTITFRKSTIGLELNSKHGLLEWFLDQRNEIKGYQNAIFSGLVSTELANAIELVMNKFPNMYGLFNIAGEPISKYLLLHKINKVFKRRATIIADTKFMCDRSLDGSKFHNYSGYIAPSWDSMLSDLSNQIKERNDI